MQTRRCRWRECRQEFSLPKPNYYFCCYEHLELHYAQHDYRGYSRSHGHQYDRGYHEGFRGQPRPEPIPPHIWKALAVLVHPDRWQESPALLMIAHEAMVWLNTHRPEGK
jgi:hypothetical protein